MQTAVNEFSIEIGKPFDTLCLIQFKGSKFSTNTSTVRHVFANEKNFN